MTRRFPDLRVGFLEGGAGWGAHAVRGSGGALGEAQRQGGAATTTPSRSTRSCCTALYQQYGGEEVAAPARRHPRCPAAAALGVSNNSRRQPQDPGALDDFARAGIEKIEDIRDRYVPNFYFGSEADDPTVAYAFNTKVNPLGAQLNAFWASDSGHWDVPDLTEVLADTWSLVERGAPARRRNFRDLVFTHPYNFFAGKNPGFFADRGRAEAEEEQGGLECGASGGATEAVPPDGNCGTNQPSGSILRAFARLLKNRTSHRSSRRRPSSSCVPQASAQNPPGRTQGTVRCAGARWWPPRLLARAPAPAGGLGARWRPCSRVHPPAAMKLPPNALEGAGPRHPPAGDATAEALQSSLISNVVTRMTCKALAHRPQRTSRPSGSESATSTPPSRPAPSSSAAS